MTCLWFDHGLSTVIDAVRLIKAGSPEVRVLVTHREPEFLALVQADRKAIEEAFDLASPDGVNACIDWCLDICKRFGVDLFCPQSKLKVVAEHKSRFTQAGVKLMLPADTKMLKLVDDKGMFYQAALAAGIPMPLTREVSSLAELDHAIDEIRSYGLQACVKPPRGIFGAGFWLLDESVSPFDALMDPDLRRLPAALLRSAVASEPRPRRLLVMEYLPGREWSVDVLAKEGVVISVSARLKESRTQVISTQGCAIDLATRVMQHFKLSELINIQCRESQDGTLKLLEINTRMSGGCAYALEAGINLPSLQVALARGLSMPGPSLAHTTPDCRVYPRTQAEMVALDGEIVDSSISSASSALPDSDVYEFA